MPRRSNLTLAQANDIVKKSIEDLNQARKYNVDTTILRRNLTRAYHQLAWVRNKSESKQRTAA